MIFTPEERRALFALGTVLVFGQLLAWTEDWRSHAPDRELAAWLNQVRHVRAEADSVAVGRGAALAGRDVSLAGRDASVADGRDASVASTGTDSDEAAPADVAPAVPAASRAEARSGGALSSAAPEANALATASGARGEVRAGGPSAPGQAPSTPSRGRGELREEPLSSLPPGLLESGRIRIDLATAEQLTSLPGIGPSLAARIVEARSQAPFRAVDDLLRVKGIGAKTLERLRDYVSVETDPSAADSSLGEQHVDAAESRRRSEAGSGGPHQ